MNKYKYIIVTIIVTIMIISALTVVVYSLRRTSMKQGEENVLNVTQDNKIAYDNIKNHEDTNATIKTSAVGDEKISPDATIIFDKHYKKCGHTITEKSNVSNKMVNLNRQELQELYSDWQIKKFDSDEIELYKEFEGSCGEHYLVKSDNGHISIYKIQDDGNTKLEEETEISTECLPEVDKETLDKGVTIYGKDKLNAYIENFE